MIFIAILLLTTLSIAGCAAFFSIYGLAAIFSGAFWPVVIMASSLEAGKLVAASYVYRYRKKISFLMKTYLISAIFILMVITSVGIFGFLSSAYQEDVLPLEEMENQIVLYDERKVELQQLKTELIAQVKTLDEQVAKIPATHSTNQRKMRESQKPEREQIQADLVRLSTEVQTATEEQHKLKANVIQQRVHTGPIIFIAKVFERDVDDATKWMIILIIFAFDPLAVMLTIGANIAILERMKKHEKMPHSIQVYEEAMGIDEDVAEEKEDTPDWQDSMAAAIEKHSPNPPVEVPDVRPSSEMEEVEVEKAPEPVVPEPIVIHDGVKIEEIRELLKEYEDRPLTPHEEQQKVTLEKTLRKEQITARTRRS